MFIPHFQTQIQQQDPGGHQASINFWGCYNSFGNKPVIILALYLAPQSLLENFLLNSELEYVLWTFVFEQPKKC